MEGTNKDLSDAQQNTPVDVPMLEASAEGAGTKTTNQTQPPAKEVENQPQPSEKKAGKKKKRKKKPQKVAQKSVKNQDEVQQSEQIDPLEDHEEPSDFWYVKRIDGDDLPSSFELRIKIKRFLESALKIQFCSINFDQLEDGYVVSVREQFKVLMGLAEDTEIEVKFDEKRFLFLIENKNPKPTFFVFVNLLPYGWGIKHLSEYFSKMGRVKKLSKVLFDGCLTTEGSVEFYERPKIFEKFGTKTKFSITFEGHTFRYKLPGADKRGADENAEGESEQKKQKL